MIIREATAELWRAYSDRPAPVTFTGWAATIEDRVVGVGGISWVGGVPVAFSEMKDELRARRRDVVRCYRFLEAEIGKFGQALFAECSEPTSGLILERLGFRPTPGKLGDKPMMVRP